MDNQALIISQIRQRLEILYQLVEKLEGQPAPGPGGTTDYNDLDNKPKINNITLSGNKSASDLGLATAAALSSLISDFNDLFAQDSITLEQNDQFPDGSWDLLRLHKPICVNGDNYYFFNETGIDYDYFAITTSGAFPMISLLQILKENHRVLFYNTAVDTVPNDGSDNLITSNAVYDALAAKANTTDTYTKTETDTAITTAINNLDCPSSGSGYKYIESISQENGVIVPVVKNLQTSITTSVYPPTAWAVSTALKAKAEKTALTDVINFGRKNLMPFDLDAMKAGNASAGYTWNGNVCTISDGSTINLTATVDTDNGTITIAGSKGATSSGLNFRIVPAEKAFDLPLGNYVLSGCPSGGSSTTYQMRALINNSSVFAQDTGSKAEFTTTANTIERIEVALGTAALTNVNLVFKPMIDTKAINDTDSTYEPYAPSNKELWEMIKALQ